MQVKCTVNPYIPVTHQRHLIYALVEIDPGDAQTTANAPINLGLVVDASRSMSIPILTEKQFKELQARGMAKQKVVDGVKVWQFEVPQDFHIEAPTNMDFTKEALRFVAAALRPTDRYSLVAFAEDALLMISNTPATERDELLRGIDRLAHIDLGDETYMARGMALGYKQILAGHAGDIADDALADDALADEGIRRMIVLTDGYTKEEQDAYTWARQAKEKGIVVSTMGLGLDFNEELLISLADVSGGHAYFIEDPQEIPAAFEQELAVAQSITWRDLSLTLVLPADVALRRAHRIRPTIAKLDVQDDAIELGDLEAEQPPAALLELVVPPRPAGDYRLARARLHGRPTGGGAGQVLDSQDILVRYTERPDLAKRTDAHLMSVIQRVSAFKLQNQAMEEASRGNVAGATKRLRLAGERLIQMGEEDLGHTMLVEAEQMEKEGQMSAQGTKKLRYGTRKLR
jgi:Ca-activated chloride channel family protein